MALLVSPGVSVNVVDEHFWPPLRRYNGPMYIEILEFTETNGPLTREKLEQFYLEHKVFTKLKDPDQIYD